jgi:hypothetical protein
VWAFLRAIWRAPLTPAQRLQCYRHVAAWAASRAFSERGQWAGETIADDVPPISVRTLVAGRDGRPE